MEWLSFPPRRRWTALLLGVAVFLLYAYTAAPSIVALYDDSLEFQLVGPTFGIAHPTGYPLYILLAGLWSRVLFPLGNWAWRMNLFSALAGAVTVALIHPLTCSLLEETSTSPRSRASALLVEGAGITAALAFALSPVWWSQATVAEVYTLHNLLVLAVLLTAIRVGWDPRRTQATRLAALLGLGLAHHRTILLLGPGLLVYLLWRAGTQRRKYHGRNSAALPLVETIGEFLPGFTRDMLRPQRRWLRYAAGFILPLLLYLHLPLRAAMGAQDLEGAYVNTWNGFWRHVLATGYGAFLTDNPLAVSRSPGDWLGIFQAQFGLLGLLLGGYGLAAGLSGRAKRPEWTLMALTLLANLGFAAAYRVADVEVFLLPAFLCLAVGIGAGLLHGARLLQNGLDRLDARRAGALAPGMGAVLAAALVLSGLGGRGPAVDRHRDWRVHDYAVAMAKVNFPPDSRVVGLRGQITALQYMQQAEGLAPNATGVPLDDPAARRRFVEEAVAAGLPVFLTQEVEGIGARFSFSGHGPLVRVWPRGQAQPGAPAISLDWRAPQEPLRLMGYDMILLQQAGGPGLRLVLYWLPEAPQQRVLKLSLRVVDANETPLLVEDRFPLRQVALAPDWLPGEVVRDVHDLSLATLLGGEPRSLLVIVYDAASVEEIGRLILPISPSILQVFAPMR